MFAKKPDNMAKPAASPRPATVSTFSVLGADMIITGNIEAGTDLHVDGRINGDITCNSLVQGEASDISGAIRADNVRIAGQVCGTITAREVVVLKTARIDGDVAYDTLTVEQGARLEGRLSPNGGQLPPAIVQAPLPQEAGLVISPKD